MLVDEVPHSFMKKNYNYSHCPLKKRPFYYTSEDEEEAPEAIKGIKIMLPFDINFIRHSIFISTFICKHVVRICALYIILTFVSSVVIIR